MCKCVCYVQSLAINTYCSVANNIAKRQYGLKQYSKVVTILQCVLYCYIANVFILH